MSFALKNIAYISIFVLASVIFLRSVSCEESMPVPEEVVGTNEKITLPEKEISTNGKLMLLEEYKTYLATPRNMFLHYCASCHGDNADGKGIYFTIDLEPKPTNLTDVDYMAKLTDDYLLNWITKGSAVMERSDLCPPWGGTLEEERIKGIISYLRKLTIAKSTAGEKSVVEEVGTMTASEAGSTGAPVFVKWGVLLGLCIFFMVSARKEWMKLKIEKESPKQ